MSGFKIKKMRKKKNIGKLTSDLDGFVIHWKNEDIKEIKVVSINISSILIGNSFAKKYKKILEMYLEAFNEEGTTDSNLMMILDEIKRMKDIINKKFMKYLKKADYEKFLKRLDLLDKEIKTKIVNICLIKEQQYAHNINAEKNKSR